MARSLHRTGHRHRRANANMFATYGRTCWLCGHEGATEADHLVPISVDPDQPVDADGRRPAHGSSGPCTHPDCVKRKGKPRSCNQERGNARPKRKLEPLSVDVGEI